MISMANRMAEDIFGMDKASIVNRAYQDAVWGLSTTSPAIGWPWTIP